jgi:hypothetical protein
MNFKQVNNISELLKKAEVEVLLTSITIEDGSNVFVYPANCPGKGRKQDILLDEEGKPACMSQGKRCSYFKNAEFKLTDYTKKIICGVM